MELLFISPRDKMTALDHTRKKKGQSQLDGQLVIFLQFNRRVKLIFNYD